MVRIRCSTSALGARIITDVPTADLSWSFRATLHEHSYLLPEWVLADRSLDVNHRLHRLAIYLQEALSALDASES